MLFVKAALGTLLPTREGVKVGPGSSLGPFFKAMSLMNTVSEGSCCTVLHETLTAGHRAGLLGHSMP